MNIHDVTLNIHYSIIDDEISDILGNIYKSMPFYSESIISGCPSWTGEDIKLTASVESGGIQISGTMPDEQWKEWYRELTQKLTVALGYPIGDAEDGFEFVFEKPVISSKKKKRRK
ncbi:MAG: hypothetical protein IJ446_08755 [Oscillospiraceae bacterium]|nr:hypothetical protein [Oscillospiraceae bacterium]